MSNETIKNKWLNLLNSFEELLIETNLNRDSYVLKYLKQKAELIKFYSKEFKKNKSGKLNFIDIQKKFNFDFNEHKKEETSNEYIKKVNIFIKMLFDFLDKNKSISKNNYKFRMPRHLLKAEWESFNDLLDIINLHDFLNYKINNPLVDKLIFKELYSILDRITVEFCEKIFEINISNINEKILYDNLCMDIFFSDFLKLKTNKNNIILLKKYEEANQEISWEKK